jgi:glycosyltransferase involved in cell wall biosynthesis
VNQNFRYPRPDIVREGAPASGTAVPGGRHYRICAITYLVRPQNLPPFYNAALSLTTSGYDIEAFGTVGRVSKIPHEEITPGFTFTRVGIRSRTFFLNLPGRLGNNVVAAGLQYLFSFLEYNIKIFLRTRKCSADLVEAHDLPSLFPATVIARLRRLPLVYHAHELWPEMGANVRFSGLWRWLEKTLIGRAALVVVPEENRARIYLNEYGARELPLVVANCPPFRNASGGSTLRDIMASKGVKASTIVLYQGVISSERCIEEIVAASEFFREDIALTLMGTGFDTWSNPESRLPVGRRIVYIPHVAYDSLFRYTASAQIGLLFYRNTCRNNYYCAPNKLYEYMMMGLPVVTCNYPGLVRFVEDQGIGLCVDPEDPRAIADAVNRIAGDSALRDRMRANCLRLAKERWNWETEFRTLQAAYSSLLDASAPAHSMPDRSIVRERA